MKKLAVSLCSLTLLSGCASILTGTNQKVTVNAYDQATEAPLSQYKCTMIDGAGARYTLTSTNNLVTVPRSKDPLQVKCSVAGYDNYQSNINSTINPAVFLDVLFWPTFFVDIATGAVNKYPARYDVWMEKS